ncbi:hypothetical protein [Streptomyces sp. NPDC017448]|uniref:hypothetical protein n=1 Tax=Streptomyces sp. NPDC017448 TaxID=3364996 RepID=UPI00379E80D2
MCDTFARSSRARLKKYAPNVPAETREPARPAKKVWSSPMEKPAAEAADADCRTVCHAVKAGWWTEPPPLSGAFGPPIRTSRTARAVREA